jgi:sugar lactone lactonase YvrE
LVYANEVINLSDIKRKTITADKAINNVSFNQNEAYLSCGFGIVVVNLSKKEIKDTYYIGDDGGTLGVNDVDFHNGSIYAATNEGLKKALLSGTNLADFNNWLKVDNISYADEKFSHLGVHGGSLIANYTPDEWSEDEMFILENNSWEPYLGSIRYVSDMQSNGNYLAVSSRNDVFIIDNNHSIIGQINKYVLSGDEVSPIKPRSASVSNEGIIWIADYENALIKLSGETFEAHVPSGPTSNNVFFLGSNNSSVWVTPGGRTDTWGNAWQAPAFQRLKNGEWTNFSKAEIPEFKGFFDIVCMAVDPSDENHFFVGSWGGGLLEFRNDELVERYTNLNSPLETALPGQPNEPFVRVGGLDFDAQGNLWISNSEVTKNIHKLTPAGEWESFSMSEVVSKNIGQLEVTDDGDKWVLVPRGNGAYVVDRTGAQSKRLNVTAYFTNGSDELKTEMNDVYSIAKDQDGAIWMGTSKGVIMYSRPSRVWDTDPFYGAQPGLDLGDGIYHPLLHTETVTAIAIDGANRKWFGTKNSGVFLVSETGENEILNFSTENSPLLSNNILAITINQKNGEVFFGTDKGLVSYQGDATGDDGTYNNVYVYPNPVRENYDGPVTITGLISNSDIKITDISGNLVFKTTSTGGQAVWDGKNRNGRRVKTGVYLVFCNDENGEETHITKLLFIN